jgi:hypothetical protein
MADNIDKSGVWAEASQRIACLLGALGGTLTPSDAGEVQSFLNAREYGLALETLVAVLADRGEPIGVTFLREIDGVADVLGVADEPFVARLHQMAGQSAGTRAS